MQGLILPPTIKPFTIFADLRVNIAVGALMVIAAATVQPALAAPGAKGHEADKWADVMPADDATRAATAKATQEADRQRRAERAYVVARYVKKQMHDPSSFELVSAVVTAKNGVCIRYRGKNAFNAKVVEEFAVDQHGTAKQPSAVCTLKSDPVDVSFIRRMF